MEKIKWETKAFKELTIDEYFEIIHLRTAVFVVEQKCPYQEVDETDRSSYHLYGRVESGKIIAVARIVPAGVSYKEISLGRITVGKEYRGKGIANELINESFKFIKTHLGKQNIRISAQQYLLNYYIKHGFKQVGEMYLEDGIPHIEMIANFK